MSTPMTAAARAALNRRNFLKCAGTLIVGFRMADVEPAGAQFGQAPLAGAPPMDQVDSWIAITADGGITAYSGKEELGQGISRRVASPTRRISIMGTLHWQPRRGGKHSSKWRRSA
jgi:hypothetical protein